MSCSRCGFDAAESSKFMLPPSPIGARLRTNFAPSGTEVTAMQIAISEATEVLATTNDEIARINNEVSRLQATLATLLQKRTEAQHFIDGHQRILSTQILRRFPPEIMSMIFLLSRPSPYAMKHVLRLASVCWNWRNIALASPRLWSAIELNWSLLLCRSMTRAKLFLSRCGNIPITFCLDISSFSAEGWVPLQNIQPFIQRSQHIDLTIPSDASYDGLVVDCPLLKSLAINSPVTHPDIFHGSESVMALFGSIPQLQTLRLGGYIFPSHASTSWSQLQELCVCSNASEFLDVLRWSPNLLRLSIDLQWVKNLQNENIQAGTIITHSNLTHLDIRAVIGVNPIIQCLSFPALISFSLDQEFGDWSQVEFLPFIMRSSSTLRRLSFAGFDLGDQQLLEILRLTPGLAYLCLLPETSDCMTTMALNQLTCQSSQVMVLPNLHTIQLWTWCLDGDAFVDMVASRLPVNRSQDSQPSGCDLQRTSAAKICTVVFYNGYGASQYVTDAHFAKLRAFKERGLEVILHHECGWFGLDETANFREVPWDRNKLYGGRGDKVHDIFVL